MKVDSLTFLYLAFYGAAGILTLMLVATVPNWISVASDVLTAAAGILMLVLAYRLSERWMDEKRTEQRLALIRPMISNARVVSDGLIGTSQQIALSQSAVQGLEVLRRRQEAFDAFSDDVVLTELLFSTSVQYAYLKIENTWYKLGTHLQPLALTERSSRLDPMTVVNLVREFGSDKFQDQVKAEFESLTRALKKDISTLSTSPLKSAKLPERKPTA